MGWQIRRLVSYVRKLRRRSEQAKHEAILELKALVQMRKRKDTKGLSFGYPASESSEADDHEEDEDQDDMDTEMLQGRQSCCLSALVHVCSVALQGEPLVCVGLLATTQQQCQVHRTSALRRRRPPVRQVQRLLLQVQLQRAMCSCS